MDSAARPEVARGSVGKGLLIDPWRGYGVIHK